MTYGKYASIHFRYQKYSIIIIIHRKEIDSYLKAELADISDRERRYNLSFGTTECYDYRWSNKTYLDIREQGIYTRWLRDKNLNQI